MPTDPNIAALEDIPTPPSLTEVLAEALEVTDVDVTQQQIEGVAFAVAEWLAKWRGVSLFPLYIDGGAYADEINSREPASEEPAAPVVAVVEPGVAPVTRNPSGFGWPRR
jgi:hypothetical protein